MVDHNLMHDICPECWLERHPDEALATGLHTESERCCWCATRTRTGLTETAPADEVPRHRRDPAWLAAAGFRPEELHQADPRVVEDQ